MRCLGGHNDGSTSHYDPLKIVTIRDHGILPWFHGFAVNAHFGGDVRDRYALTHICTSPFDIPFSSAVVRGGQGWERLC